MNQTGNTILITGGGSGIGKALAHRFHDLGNTVIVSGRRREILEAAVAARPNMHAIELDVESAQDIASFAERLLAERPPDSQLERKPGFLDVVIAKQPLNLADAVLGIRLVVVGQ